MHKIILLLSVLLSLNSCYSQENNESIKIITTKELQTVISNKNVQLIDVRTSFEYKQGFIGNAVNANIYTAAFTKATKNLDKSKPVYLYCHKGVRSNTAAHKLIKLGFTTIYDYSEGWAGWKNKTK